MSDLAQRNAEAMLRALHDLRAELGAVQADNERLRTTQTQQAAEIASIRQQLTVALTLGRGSGPTT